MKAIFGCSLEVVNVGCCGFGCSGNWMLWSWMLWYLFSFGCCGFVCYGFGWYYFGRCEYFLWKRFWMFFGGYERWMLRFWMLRKLDATLLDASILTRCRHHCCRSRHYIKINELLRPSKSTDGEPPVPAAAVAAGRINECLLCANVITYRAKCLQ